MQERIHDFYCPPVFAEGSASNTYTFVVCSGSYSGVFFLSAPEHPAQKLTQPVSQAIQAVSPTETHESQIQEPQEPQE